MDQMALKERFRGSSRPHILMITNHGIHDWVIRSGLADTGGQNQYVKALSDTLVALGYRITIYNRGGFPDPITGELRTGSSYKDEFSRITYLEGGGDKFIRKEDIDRGVLLEEAGFAQRLMEDEATHVHLIISHYWDGALLACMIRELLGIKAKHVWVPHSIGALKMENYRDKPPEEVEPLRLDERIAYEKEALPKIDAVASTSGDITRVLRDFYGREPEIFLPPCIDTNKFYPIDDPSKCERIFGFLKRTDAKTGGKVRGKKLILEMSRTDRTKRKDILLRAFSQIYEKHDAMLLLRINPKAKEIYDELAALIKRLRIRGAVVLVGMVPDEMMAELFAISTVYASPSEMEGFGMSVQEACACRRPIIASDLIPFAVENLVKNSNEEIVESEEDTITIQWGEGGAVVPAGKVAGFAHALDRLLGDSRLRDDIASKAYKITIPHFTWPAMTKRMLEKVGMTA